MQTPTSPAEQPAGNQFSLRGLFVLITAVSVILALLALAIRQPLHWLGTLGVIAFCLATIAILELVRKLFPPKPRRAYYIPAAWGDPLQTMDFRGGENPFASSAGQSPFAEPPQRSEAD